VLRSSPRREFGKLTPLYPQERLRLETEPNLLTGRIIDLVAPIGKGQRGLIVSPPKAGKTMVLQASPTRSPPTTPRSTSWSCSSTSAPKRSPTCSARSRVRSSPPPSTVRRRPHDGRRAGHRARQAPGRDGHDVVVLLDSITRLGRAYNLAAPPRAHPVRWCGLPALYPPKKFFGAARNIENGGSLTIIATALVETGSQDGRGDLRGVQGHRQHGAQALTGSWPTSASSRPSTSTPPAPAARSGSCAGSSCGPGAAGRRDRAAPRSPSASKTKTNYAEFLVQVQQTSSIKLDDERKVSSGGVSRTPRLVPTAGRVCGRCTMTPARLKLVPGGMLTWTAEVSGTTPPHSLAAVWWLIMAPAGAAVSAAWARSVRVIGTSAVTWTPRKMARNPGPAK
jgi:transcription termination factor Rho